MTNESRPTQATEAAGGQPLPESPRRSDDAGAWTAPAPDSEACDAVADPGPTGPGAASPGDAVNGDQQAGAPPAEPEAVPSAPRRRPSIAGILVLPLLLAVVAGAAYLTRGQWLPAIESRLAGQPAPPPPPAVQSSPSAAPEASPVAAAEALGGGVASLQNRIAELENTLRDLQQRSAAGAAAPADGAAAAALAPRLAALAQQNEEMAARLTRLEQLSAGLQSLSERVARLEQAMTQTAALESHVRTLTSQAQRLQENFSDVNATVLAVGQLAEAVNAGQPFVRPLAAVRALVADDPDMADAVNALQAHAATGVATVPALAARFPATADAVARAAPVTEGEAWTDRVVNQFATLLTIRTIGSTAARSGGLDAALSEAQIALDGGDLATAVAIVGDIEGSAAAPAAEWLAAARARLAADQALATLQQRALDRLNATKG